MGEEDRVFREGYGLFWFRKENHGAHRISYCIFNDDCKINILEKKGIYAVYICHSCDNTSCVNPTHLFIGDAFSNMQDMMKKGRQAKSHSVEIVEKIRKEYNNGKTIEILSEEFNIPRSTIGYWTSNTTRRFS